MMKQIKTTKKRRFMPFWVIVGIFLVATVFFTIETATKGAELTRLTLEEKNLLEENRSLSSRLVQVSSLTNLEERAENMGFTKPTKVIYVLEEIQVAKVPQP